MRNRGLVAVTLATLLLAETLPAPAAPATPLAGLRDLVGAWKCTYRAGSTSLPYDARYAYDGDAQVLREDVALPGGGDEELLAYDTAHRMWSVVVFDGHGSTYVMRGPGSDPRHFAYRSVYPGASIAVRFDRVSAAEYTLHGTVRMGGKTIASVDTFLR
jgi:hypothetical protein